MRNGTLALVVVVCSAVALAGQAPVPVHEEPLHKPVFQNKAVQIGSDGLKNTFLQLVA